MTTGDPTHIDWTRYWAPLGQTVHEEGDGFVVGPETDQLIQPNDHFREFEDFHGSPLLVVVGDPGLGKSYEVKASAERLKAILTGGRDEVLFVDMKRTTDESRLRQLIFGSEEFTQWIESDHVLHIFLDSLDEIHQSVRNVKSLILEGLDDADFRRLRIRIACRTAERIDGLELELARRFGLAAPDVVELMPLTKREIGQAADSEGLDREAFFSGLVENALQPFASSPNFLFKLTREFAERGEFPNSGIDIFERFCIEGCREPNHEETARDRISEVTLRDTASRIAVAMTLSGRSVVAVERDALDGESSIHDFLTEEERSGDPPVALTEAEDLLKRALQTPLFTGYTSHTVGFKSKTIAEYLAARYLANSDLGTGDLVRLTTAEYEGRVWVVPQMIEVAKWLAQMHREYREFAVRTVPSALVGGDVRYLSEEERQQVLTAVFDSVEAQEVEMRHRPFRRSLKQLDNPEASDLISRRLRDKSLRDETRDTATDAIRSFGLVDLMPETVAIALDESESIELRTAALYAIGDVGEREHREAIAELGLTPPEGDIDDEIKGSALRAAFPSALSAEQIFGHLTTPKRDALVGAYSGFLFYGVVQELSDGDLVHAMDWLESLRIDDDDPYGPFGTLRQKLFARLTELPVEDMLWPRLATYVKAYLEGFHPLLERADFRGDPVLTETGRRHLVTHLAPFIGDEKLPWTALVMSKPSLATYDDVDWILEQLESSVGSESEQNWADIAWAATNLNSDPERFGDACNLSDRFFERARPTLVVELGSEFEDDLRENFEIEQTKSEGGDDSDEGTQRVEFSPEFVERAEELFLQAENGDLEKFWQFASIHNRSIRRFTDNQNESARLVQLIEILPENFARRICDMAAIYLREFDPDHGSWIGKSGLHWPSFAAYRSLRFLDSRDESWIDENLATVWRWRHTIVWWPYSGGEESEFRQRLVQKLFDDDADVFVEAFVDFVRAQMEHQRLAIVPMDGMVGQLDIAPFEEPVIRLLPELEESTEEWSALLRFMISNGSKQFLEVARDAIRDAVGSERDDPIRIRGVDAATMLAVYDLPSSWDALAESFHADAELGQSVTARVAYERESSIWTGLSSGKLGSSFEWLQEQFPIENDVPIEDVDHAEHQVYRLRNNCLTMLSHLGTRDAVDEITRLSERFASLEFLPRLRHEAIIEYLRAERIPVLPGEAIQLCRNPELRAIASEADLRRVVLESLARCQYLLDTTGEGMDFWNTSPDVKPKAEGLVSDKLKRWFERDISERGILVNREAIVQTLHTGRDGDRTDLKVEASGQGEPVCVVIEVKGCWNRDIPGSIENQLVGKYLEPMGIGHGVYLVAKFSTEEWVSSDDRRSRSFSRKSYQEAEDELNAVAAEVSARRMVQIDSVVLRIGLK